MDFASLSTAEAAKLFDVDERTIRNWMTGNGLPFTGDGKRRRISASAAVQWYVSWRLAESGKSGKKRPSATQIDDTESYENALARKTRAEANLKELQLAKAREEVASIADVERVLSASNMAVQTQLLAVPSRLATQMLGLEDHGRAVAILTTEMRQVLTNLASIDAIREASGMASEDME